MSAHLHMLERMDVPSAARSWPRRVLSVLGSVVAFVVVTYLGLVFTAYGAGEDPPPFKMMTSMLGTIAAFASGASMFWRMKYPARVLGVVAALSIALPLDPIGPALAFSWVVAKRPLKDLYWAVPLVMFAVAAPLFRDWRAPADETVLASSPGQDVAVMSVEGYVFIWTAGLALAFAVGWARRSWGLAEQAATAAQEREERVVELEGELTRQEERDLIAREMHDTVAHHLSLVSLHAGALEVTSEDPSVPEASKAMRRSAHQALEEMRALIQSLRDSESGGYAQPNLALSSLPALVRDAQGAGARINATFTVDGKQVGEDAENVKDFLAGLVAAPVDRAAYRIVQEALTNALKHAPREPVDVKVEVEEGVRLSVSNPVITGEARAELRGGEELETPRVEGAGAGILGIWERVSTLGGNAEVGLREGHWVVEVWLPKHAA